MKYFGIFIGFALFIVLLMFLLFSQPSNKTSTGNQSATPVNIMDYAEKPSQVRYIINGPIVSQEKFTSQVITINANSRTIQVLQGYDGTVERTQTLDNNQNAYTTFLSALNNSGYTLQQKSSTTNRNGSCSSGKRFSYQIFDNTDMIQDTWNTSCSSRIGTFNGNTAQIRTLFDAQIPNYSTFMNGISI